MRVSLQVALAADFRLGALGKKRRVLSDFGQLITIRGLFHDGVASDATHPSVRVRTRVPIGLHPTLVARQAGLVLKSDRFPAVFPKCDQRADSFTAARGDVVAARPVAVLASLFLAFVARVVEKNFPHQRLGKFLELCGVASLTNLRADVGGKRLFGGFLSRFFDGFFFRRPSGMSDAKQQEASQWHQKKSSHDLPPSGHHARSVVKCGIMAGL